MKLNNVIGRRLAAGVAGLAAAAAMSVHAATLSQVPMQGTMIMPMIYYHSTNNTLTVHLGSTVAQLTPLLVSNPGDYFDPADPWYDSLDPTRQGLAFSRRYGFVMASKSDVVPIGLAIWLRKLSSSPGLAAYRYGDGEPKQWEPVFGTAGTTNALEWDQSMWHPCFTASPGTNTYTATFEAFLMDTVTGTPVSGGSTGPFVLNWTDVPDGRPTLAFGPNLVLSWPATATNYLLEAAPSPTSSSWSEVTNSPVVQDGQCLLPVAPTGTSPFFRMKLKP